MSPQPGWGIWFFIALPVCIITILLIWVLLLITFQPGRNTTIVPIRPMKDKFTGIQWFISIVTVATIILWCLSHQLENVFGDMGVIAIIPIALFFGTGILTKEDFNNFLWTIIILAAGGLALGKAVNSSGLLHTIAKGITEEVGHLSLYGVMSVFAALIAVVATFISHTVAALIILPLVAQVGDGMENGHPNLLVMGSVLMASAAMGLPTSGFPNMSKSYPLSQFESHADVCRSGHYDGRLADRTAILEGPAFLNQRYSQQHHCLRCYNYAWIWFDACGWFMSMALLVVSPGVSCDIDSISMYWMSVQHIRSSFSLRIFLPVHFLRFLLLGLVALSFRSLESFLFFHFLGQEGVHVTLHLHDT
jgi:hypothetical protein